MTDPTADRIVLGPNRYGKAEVRLVRVTRATPRHEIDDLTVTSQLTGDFTAAHLDGDNAHVVTTDTQKNTVFAFARDGVGAPEAFLLRLAEHFTGSFEWVTGGRWIAERHAWQRIEVDGAPHDHAFVRTGQETRTAAVVVADGLRHVLGGLDGLTVLKTTGSGFAGFPRDRYTTLQETDDRILATSVAARWRYAAAAPDAGLDYDALYARVRRLLLASFAEGYSRALQETLYGMGRAVLAAEPELVEIRFSMPNKHHFAVDLAPFGLDNPGEVFIAADRPYGLIEASVMREGAPDAAAAWAGVAGFC